MDTATITGLRVEDAIALPRADASVVARARREERYAVHVTRDPAATDVRLRALLDGVGTVAVITDDTVDALYGPALRRRLRALDVDVIAHAVPAGEHSKSLECAVELWHWLAESALGRRDLVLCFGGGVICDMGGWVASVYMRGVPYVNLPTTLLAMVDGALGGKVAVNHPVAKNLLGAFQQPAGVICQLDHLRSLDSRQLGAGVAECIKKGVIASPAYFAFIERSATALLAGDSAALETLVRAAAAIKTTLIERDPYEARPPPTVGFVTDRPSAGDGHRLAPLLTVRRWRRDRRESDVGARRGWLEASPARPAARRARGLQASRARVRASERRVRRRARRGNGKVRVIRAGSLRWVLPVGLGETVIADDVTETEVRAALADCGVH